VFGLISHLDASQKARVRIAKGYEEVKSFCSRRQAERQPPLRSAQQQGPIQLVSVTPATATAVSADETRQKA